MSRSTELYLGLAAIVFLAGTAAIVIAEPFRATRGYSDVLPVVAAESDGRIRMDWNASHPLISEADRGLLKVRDGQSVWEYPVEKTTLLQGGLDYLRKSGDVSLTLVLLRGTQTLGQAAIHTFTPAPAAAPPAVPAGRQEPGTGSRSRS
jgi:hypothetical protein